MERKSKKIIMTVSAVLLVYCVISFVATAVFFRVVFGRYEPLPVERYYTAEDAVDHPREEHRFSNGDTELMGYYYAAEDSKGLVIYVHGRNSSSECHIPEIFAFADGGYSVFAFDSMGCAGSGGSWAGGLEQTVRDLLCALDHIEECDYIEKQRIVLVGHSSGAYAASVVSSMREDLIDACVCINGFDEPIRMMYLFAKTYAGVLADIQFPFLKAYDSLMYGELSGISASECISSADMPFLIIQGEEDEVLFEEIRLSTNIPNTVKNVVQVLVITGENSRHSDLWLAPEAAEYKAEVFGKYSVLNKEYKGRIPKDVLDDFLAGCDTALMYRIDTGFMETVLSFIEEYAGV